MKKRTLALAVMLAALLMAMAAPALAQDGPPNTITVIGNGSASGDPDIAEINVGVRTANNEVSAAFDENNQTTNAVISAVQQAGIAEDDINTVSIYAFTRDNNFDPNAAPQISYEVTNDLRIIVRDTSAVGSVIATAVNAGANNIYGLNFRISDEESLEFTAQELAMEHAADQAARYAELAGVELGEIVAISETVGGGGPIPFAAQGFGGGGGAGGGAPIEAGPLTVSVQVQVTYAIAR
ncbi:MAG: SIMPL domain-containing protein [Chloroflexota bacterium]